MYLKISKYTYYKCIYLPWYKVVVNELQRLIEWSFEIIQTQSLLMAENAAIIGFFLGGGHAPHLGYCLRQYFVCMMPPATNNKHIKRKLNKDMKYEDTSKIQALME